MAGVYSHEHTQSVASDTWVITHNLGTMAPIIDVYVEHNGQQEKILPFAVRAISNTTAHVVFSSARTGKAMVR